MLKWWTFAPISPIDKKTILESVAKTGRAVVVHEAVEQFGVGAMVSAVIAEELHGTLAQPGSSRWLAKLPGPVQSAQLEQAYMYSDDRIEAAIRKAM